MDKLLQLLESLQPGLDYAHLEDLVDGHYLDSLDILSLVASIEEEFDVTVPAVDITPDNLNSARRMWDMIQRLREEG